MNPCPYCDEFENGFFELWNRNYGSRILYETENFVVFPSLGQIVEGYLLIASKKHYVGMGQVPKELHPELEMVCQKVRSVLSEKYRTPLFFVHGSVSESKKGDCCIAHAHIHAVPVQVDVLSELAKNFRYNMIKTFDSLKEQFDQGMPYLFYESNSGERYLVEAPIVPSQLIRQIIAVKIGKPERWDWRQHYGTRELLRTVDKLRSAFA
jgi:diadenosine tetraphosphate (Ap4A) HIT family hydrolase